MKKTLTVKVKATNRAHAYAIELYPQLVSVFESFVGKQILKVDGTLLAKVKAMLPSMPNKSGLHVYWYSSKYNLAYTVKTSEMDSEHTCTYYDVVLYIGKLQGTTLTEICEAPNLRTDFTVAEILSKREKIREAEQALNDARSAVYPFAYDYDN